MLITVMFIVLDIQGSLLIHLVSSKLSNQNRKKVISNLLSRYCQNFDGLFGPGPFKVDSGASYPGEQMMTY